MTAKSTRILKEARPLIWPWCAVAIAGVLPLIHGSKYLGVVTTLGFYLGIPVLATLAFGNEFQSRTFALMLSQPIERREIWREKLMVTVFAVVTASLVFSLTTSVEINHQFPHFFIFIAAWTLAIVASAAFWTLWTRSTIGGVALNFGVLGLIVTWADVASHVFYSPYSVEANSAAVSHEALFLMAYAAVMLWLGWRKLAGFQATGGMAGDDLVTAGPEIMPRAVADLFRSRSHGAVLNLVRKEFRLLRPVWLLTILIAVGWSSVTVYQVLHEREHVRFMPITAGWVGLAGATLLAVLAGCISLGDERTSGRHSWHLTLPISARTQWLVKFLTALFAGVLCAGVVPLLLLAAGQNLLGMSVLPDRPYYPSLWLWAVVTITAAAFWCSCATDGTVTAALWVVPVLWAIMFAPYAGFWLAERFVVPLLSSTFNLYGNFRLDVYLYQCLDTGRHGPHLTVFQSGLQYVMLVPTSYVHNWGSERFVASIPVAILAVVQSYRMFKKQAIAGTRVVLRRLLPLVVLVLAISFVLVASWQFASFAADRVGSPMWFAYRGIGSFLAESDDVVAGQPTQLTLADLDKANLKYANFLPKPAIELLHDARITVVPENQGGEFRRKGNAKSQPWWFYHATVHLENSVDLLISFTKGTDRPRTKLSVHLPGAAKDEILWDW